MSKQFWNSEKLLSLTAMLISVCTLFVFVYQTNLIREQQYKSVFPYLELGNFGSYTKDYGFFLSNRGIGPAMIQSIEIHYKDSVYQEDLAKFLRHYITEEDSIYYTHSNITPGSLIPADERVILANINRKDIEMGIRLFNIINQEELDIIIEYESIYGERWRISYHEGAPQKIE